MSADISEVIKDRELGFKIYVPSPCTQSKLITQTCHAHSNAHKPPKLVAPAIFMLEKNFK